LAWFGARFYKKEEIDYIVLEKIKIKIKRSKLEHEKKIKIKGLKKTNCVIASNFDKFSFCPC
jgi:hypothetical protein